MTDRDVLTLAAAAIADWPQLWRPLLDRHVAMDDGRCTACPLPQSPTPVWPCTIAVLASTAALVNEAAGGAVVSSAVGHDVARPGRRAEGREAGQPARSPGPEGGTADPGPADPPDPGPADRPGAASGARCAGGSAPGTGSAHLTRRPRRSPCPGRPR